MMSQHGGDALATVPVLSVVMPSLNQAEFLSQAIHSVLRATDPSVELIVMDGGSSDGSLALLAALAQAFPGRITWCSEADAGPADAVNKAVRAARAPWVGWLNSDDLYTPGALDAALAHLQAHPDDVMFYGQGEHVDGAGRFLARYPTQPPTTPIAAFADGCFICQPTAFFRRDVFLALGGLDVTLRASFDFEFWLRIFKTYPGRIGFVEAVWAQSRLHAGGITARFRERVALEGLAVVRRHIGPPPGHWLLTHFEELCASQPFHDEPLALRDRFRQVLDKAVPWLAPGTAAELAERVANDPRVRLSDAEVYVGVHADGWASDDLEVRVQQGAVPVRSIRLQCRQHAPGGGGLLRIAVTGPAGSTEVLCVEGNGEFELTLTVLDQRPGARLRYRVRTEGAFVPAEVEPGSADRRALAFMVDACLPQC